jgi:hypothetical protein
VGSHKHSIYYHTEKVVNEYTKNQKYRLATEIVTLIMFSGAPNSLRRTYINMNHSFELYRILSNHYEYIFIAAAYILEKQDSTKKVRAHQNHGGSPIGCDQG